MLSLDVLTLGVTLAIVSVMSVLVLFTFWRINLSLPGVKQWTVGGLAFSLAYLCGFVAAALAIPGGWGPVFSNSLSMAGLLISIEGCRRFGGSESARRWLVMRGFIPLLAIYFLATREMPLARLFVHDGLATAGLAHMAWCMYVSGEDGAQRRINMLAALAALLLSFGFFARWIYALTVPVDFAGVMLPINAPLFLCIIIFNIGWTYGIGAACYYRSNRQVMDLAREDALTGLPNRRSIDERLAMAIDDGRRRDEGFALVVLDLNGFKQVNDLLGHGAGDRLLVAFANRLRDVVRGSDFAGRLGGDEFLIICFDLSTEQQRTAFLTRLREQLQMRLDVGSQAYQLSVSIGMATWPEDGDAIERLLTVADQRMYQDKPVSSTHTITSTSAMQSAR
jgi:diguanylate cyclase